MAQLPLVTGFPNSELEVEFEVENDLFRPEFDVLKPYYIKVLNVKKVPIQIYAEAKGDEIISLLATSNDLEKLNEEILQSVKFRFFEKECLSSFWC